MSPVYRVRIVKNELGVSATQQELKSWGLGVEGSHNELNRGTGGVLNFPPSPRQFEPCRYKAVYIGI